MHDYTCINYCTIVSPNTTTDGSVTAIPTTNETERIPTTTNTIEASSEETSTISDATTNNAIKAPIGCQGTSSTAGTIAGVAVGGIITGALIAVLVTLIIVLTTAKLTRKNDAEMKDVEPVYSVILPNPLAAASSDHQVDLNKNECYGTLRA